MEERQQYHSSAQTSLIAENSPEPGLQNAAGRTTRKRWAITEAARRLFLEQGYAGTSMDQVAALAAVSKQTVYKNFEDKEHLFRAVLTDITETADSFASEAVDSLQQTDDLTADLRHLARRYLSTVMQPHVLQLRRLIISEASRFPELGRSYYQRGPQRVLAALASSFDKLAERGWLRFEDPLLAANHFAFLVLAIPLDRALVCGDAAVPDTAEIERLADSAVSVFLSAYGNNQTRED